MNPVVYQWVWLKLHALANGCPNALGQLHTNARNKGGSPRIRRL